MSDFIRYSIVVPVFNEEEVVEESYKRLKKVMDGVNESYEIIFVNDGCRDKTPDIISDICKNDANIKLVNFSRNFGHQIAISAGMDYTNGQAIVIIDADLQDPPEVIPQMIQKWKEGYDVVYGKRIKRKGEGLFKKLTAAMFYRFLKMLTNVVIPVDVGDFRLIDRKVCETIGKIKEQNRFMRGLISWVGFKQYALEYVREERFAGKTKYPLKKMIQFATDAIISFSYKPLKLASLLGFLVSLAGFGYLIYVIYIYFTTNTVSGWASGIVISLFFHGITLIMLGIIGEYIGRIYDESKNRPLYIVRNTVGFKEEKQPD
ncbi:MAG: glycosyltransferase family 2 protein [Spirochaetales bacterium]|nr:glycosyltransferase family 2 protein [Spirochaetales bacterium]